jgi:hypothetical protein
LPFFAARLGELCFPRINAEAPTRTRSIGYNNPGIALMGGLKS